MRWRYKFDKGGNYGAPKMSSEFTEALQSSDDVYNFFYSVYISYVNNIQPGQPSHEVIVPKQFYKELGHYFLLRNNSGQIEVISNKQLAQEVIDSQPQLKGLSDRYNTDNYVCKGT